MQVNTSSLIIFGTFLALTLGAVGMYGCPQYNVYSQRLEGEAELARATYNRQVKVKESEATREAATQLAMAEVERAKGVAKANEIIGQSLKNNEAYLRYLWIHNLNEGKAEVIYVPTEAGLPILEAGKRSVGTHE